jgi:DNA mismatch repair protein MutL
MTIPPGTTAEAGLRFTPAQHSWNFPETEKIDPATGEIVRVAPAAGGEIAAKLLGGEFDRARSTPLPSELGPPPAVTEGGPLWQLHRKYIVTPIPNGVMIIDQHVAHERVIYERALRRFESAMRSTQQLLFPATIQVSPREYSLAEELFNDLAGLGFDLKLFGKNTIVLEGVPTDVRVGEEGKILAEVLSLYEEYRRDSPTTVRDNLAKSLSCRSAVKAGDLLTDTEMRQLLADLFATKMPYVCPHGRPIALRISIDEMDRRFGRL